MNKHQVSDDDLLDYLVNQLTQERSAQVVKHLQTCAQCATTVARFQALRSCLRADDTIEPPPRTLARAKAIGIRHRPAWQRPHFGFNLHSRTWSFAGGFALAIILLLGLGGLIASLEIPEGSALYPVQVAVQGLQIRLSNAGQQFGFGTSRTVPLIPVTSGPAPTLVPPSDIVISQVYGGGGNTGATFTHDFIELFNRGTTTISLAGWSLQYASATGTSNLGAGPSQITELPEISLAPGQYLLIQEARGNAGTRPLPTPDVIDPTPIALSATDGKLVLVNTTASLGCNGSTNPCLPGVLTRIVDLVGYGKADFFQGVGPAVAGTSTSGILRLNNGCTDSNSNADDFTIGAPNPRNSMSSRVTCPTVPPKP